MKSVLDKIKERYGVEVKEITLMDFFRNNESRIVLKDGTTFTTDEVADIKEGNKWIKQTLDEYTQK